MRKPITLLIIVTLSIVATSVVAASVVVQAKIFPNCIRGDVDDDFSMTLDDIKKIEDYIDGLVFLSCHQVMHADANRDRRVDEHDVESLLLDLGDLPSEYTWGDVNGDGTANEQDFLLLLQYVSSNGTTPFPSIGLETGDITGDGLINWLDMNIFRECELDNLISPFSPSPML